MRGKLAEFGWSAGSPFSGKRPPETRKGIEVSAMKGKRGGRL